MFGNITTINSNFSAMEALYNLKQTNGKINATLPKDTSTDNVTLEVALQLISDKKAKGPIKKRRFKKKTACYFLF